AMMNTYNDSMIPNSNIPPLQQDFHQYSNNNSLDLSYNPDRFMSPSPNMTQQSMQNRHMNVMQHQQPPSHSHPPMHQVYLNKNYNTSNN
ncbi:unnamed protein product, partial [Rotaria magnacalcarata]